MRLSCTSVTALPNYLLYHLMLNSRHIYISIHNTTWFSGFSILHCKVRKRAPFSTERSKQVSVTPTHMMNTCGKFH